MRKGLSLAAIALALLLGTACGGRPHAQARYVYYPGAAARPAPPPGPISIDFGARNAIGRVEIPKVGVSQPMFEGVGLDVLANGPGHWAGTAMPGDAGNNVVAGHRV